MLKFLAKIVDAVVLWGLTALARFPAREPSVLAIEAINQHGLTVANDLLRFSLTEPDSDVSAMLVAPGVSVQYTRLKNGTERIEVCIDNLDGRARDLFIFIRDQPESWYKDNNQRAQLDRATRKRASQILMRARMATASTAAA